MARKQILIVDDEHLMSLLARRILEKQGHTIEQVTDGAEAFTRIKNKKYDCVLLDINMPGMSGKELCEKIRNTSSLKSIRVIAFTAHGLPEDIIELKRIGFDTVLTKPITPEELAVAITA
jgi:two-component system cell cycle response regulator DivK